MGSGSRAYGSVCPGSVPQGGGSVRVRLGSATQWQLRFPRGKQPAFPRNGTRKYENENEKAYSAINNKEQSENLQANLDKLVEWTGDWLLTFNSQKC